MTDRTARNVRRIVASLLRLLRREVSPRGHVLVNLTRRLPYRLRLGIVGVPSYPFEKKMLPHQDFDCFCLFRELQIYCADLGNRFTSIVERNALFSLPLCGSQQRATRLCFGPLAVDEAHIFQWKM